LDQYIWLSSLVISYLLKVGQHKLQTEDETEKLMGASNGERLPSANENQVGSYFNLLCDYYSEENMIDCNINPNSMVL